MKKNIKLWIFCILMTFLLVISWSLGSVAQASVQEDFINRMSPTVIKVAHKYNLYPSVMMAQAALESDFGQSSLSQDANNYFGIKGSYNGQSVSMPTMEYNQSGQPYYIDSDFKKYPSVEASVEDNAQLIRDGIYGDPTIYSGAWRENASDSSDAAMALGHKYATDPNYANYLASLIQQYNLGPLLDNAWKRLHIAKLKKAAHRYLVKLKRYQKSHRSNARKNRGRIASFRSKVIKYTKLYKNDQATLGQTYGQYQVYDHLSRMDADDWKRLNAYVGIPVYIDLMGMKGGHHYYRIRFSPSQTHKYWVRSKALKFVDPIYYSHPYRINAQQLNLTRAYNQILGTSPTSRLVPSHFKRSSYRSNLFAIVPQKRTNNVWYHIKNNRNRLVWVSANPRRTTQYLSYHEQKRLNSDYTQAKLYSHAADQAYQSKQYSWSQVKPRRDTVTIDRLAIDTHQPNNFWYRINNQHRTYWTDEAAFK